MDKVFVKPIKRSGKTVQETITDQLRKAIMFGELQGGTHLRQDELAKQYDVSITPVREAIKQLTSEGLVRMDPYRGSFVCKLDERDRENTLALRDLIEAFGIRLVVRNITDEEIDHAGEFLQEMMQVDEFDEWYTLNARFHDFLNSCSRSQCLIQVQATLRNFATLYTPTSIEEQQGQIADSNEQHRDLIEAFKKRDEEKVVQITKAHSQKTYKRFIP